MTSAFEQVIKDTKDHPSEYCDGQLSGMEKMRAHIEELVIPLCYDSNYETHALIIKGKLARLKEVIGK